MLPISDGTSMNCSHGVFFFFCRLLLHYWEVIPYLFTYDRTLLLSFHLLFFRRTGAASFGIAVFLDFSYAAAISLKWNRYLPCCFTIYHHMFFSKERTVDRTYFNRNLFHHRTICRNCRSIPYLLPHNRNISTVRLLPGWLCLDMLTLICAALQRDGHQIDTESDTAAVQPERCRLYDLLLFNIMMPKEDGFSLLRRIRTEVDCPILFPHGENRRFRSCTRTGTGSRRLYKKTVQYCRTLRTCKCTSTTWETSTGSTDQRRIRNL